MTAPVGKLVRQIREALASKGNDAAMESFAADYARLCHEANQRLESCAAMLEKGSDYQALQLAETEPALLDLIGALSFAETPDWAAYCAENHLPVAAKFDSKAVQALDQLYGKGINTNHPLYKDYRGAVTARDDARAIQIIRSIVRLNPEDINAKTELARLENKLFQIKLQELRTALTQRDESATLSSLAELERLGTAERLSELPEYARASSVRREVARRDAIALAERLVESLDEECQAGSWRMVGDILVRVRTLQSEHGFQLDQEQAVKCQEMQRYFDTQRGAADETARFDQAISTLGGLTERFDTRLLARSTLTYNEAQNLQGEFNRLWREVEKFQRPVPEAFVQRVRSSAGSLRAELDRLQRQRRFKIIAGSVAAVAVIVVAAWFTIGAVRAQDYAKQLSGLRESGQVDAAEKMIAQIRKEETGLAAKPALAARLDETDRWTRDERAKLTDVEARLNDLEATAKAGMAEVDPMTLSTKLESTNQLIESIASGLRAAPAGRMLVVRNQFEAYVTTLREKLIAAAEEELTGLENLAGTKLAYDQPKEVIVRTLGEIDPPLKSLEARVKPAVAALELPSSQQARVSALRKRADLFHTEIATLATVNEAILQTDTLEAYLQALGGYKSSKLAQTLEVNDARKILASLPKTDDLFASLLQPDDPVGWAATKADATGEAFAPDTVLPAEMSKLLALRGDIYLNDIWEVAFVDLRRKGEKRVVYSRGDLKKEGPNQVGDAQITRWIGAIYDPTSKLDPPAFIPNTTYSLERSTYGVTGDGEVTSKRLSGPSDCLSRLELNRMTDATGTKFERPLLRAFDELVRDKSANVIFKAYAMQQLEQVLKIRPYAWGLEHCASLRGDLVELDKICDDTMLRSQDWLLERKASQLGPKLTTFFNGLQKRGYLAEGRLHRDIVRRLLQAGLQFGGFVDCEGQPHLLGEARSSKLLWTLSGETPKLLRYIPGEPTAQGTGAQTAGFSPVFFVPVDRESVLADIGRKVSDSPSTPTNLPAIPWLETP